VAANAAEAGTSHGESTPQFNPTALQQCFPNAAQSFSVPNGFNGVPTGVIPQVISSSENTHASMRGRPGNTGVKRKALTGHALVADATKSTGIVMATQMQ